VKFDAGKAANHSGSVTHFDGLFFKFVKHQLDRSQRRLASVAA
jgi:hypothetical protein